MADVTAMMFLRVGRHTNEPFYTDCICCRKNFETFRVVMMREYLRAQANVPASGDEIFIIYSRPEELSCADCEAIKERFKSIWESWYEIRKDREGFIILTLKPRAGIFLLKNTAVCSHYFTAEQQSHIQLLYGN